MWACRLWDKSGSGGWKCENSSGEANCCANEAYAKAQVNTCRLQQLMIHWYLNLTIKVFEFVWEKKW